MVRNELFSRVQALFRDTFGASHRTAAYAPGRLEILGNHTDYNEGFVLSAAIDLGTFFLVAPSGGPECRLVAGDVMEESVFDVGNPEPDTRTPWANYVKGVLAGLLEGRECEHGFYGMFLGNVPLGAGLSSSAALEMSSGLALAAHYAITIEPVELARVGQRAEHEYAGARTGLLDQLSSLFGQHRQLVLTDFRSLEIDTVPVPEEGAFLVCNTRVKHALVDSEYNERRAACERAAAAFAAQLSHPVAALRDVTLDEWKRHRETLDAQDARRVLHVIGENDRVLRARDRLNAGRLEAFGRLMSESHRSSRENFENSCPELDFVVDTALELPGVLGARLSGGGFGGAAVVLVHPRQADTVGQALGSAFRRRFGSPCDVLAIEPSDGARLVDALA